MCTRGYGHDGSDAIACTRELQRPRVCRTRSASPIIFDVVSDPLAAAMAGDGMFPLQDIDFLPQEGEFLVLLLQFSVILARTKLELLNVVRNTSAGEAAKLVKVTDPGARLNRAASPAETTLF